MVPQDRKELVARDGLFDGADDPDAIGLRHRRGGSRQGAVERADENHRDRERPFPDSTNELPAVDVGHLEVGDDDVHGLADPAQHLGRTAAGGGLADIGHAHRVEGVRTSR